MGLSLSSLVSCSKKILRHRLFGLTEKVETAIVRSISFGLKNGKTMVRTVSFKKNDSENNEKSDCSREVVIDESMGSKKWKLQNLKLETTVSFKSLVLNGGVLDPKGQGGDELFDKSNSAKALPEQAIFFSPRPVGELDAAAVKVQKVYKSYRTRRNLADCAVVVEELWWKALDFAALKRSSVLFFEKPETAVSRWARAGTRAAKVGKGLSKDEKAQKLALRHWLEAIDPRHRYGHNLHLYYVVWFNSESSQPFFYWLDVGDGKEVNLEICPRTKLQRECIKYLGPKEREAYEVQVEDGKLVYSQNWELVETVEGVKWIFVLSTSRKLYIGEKKKGLFQHSSFLAGGATTAAGRLVVHNGVLEAIWAYSGHYRPTEENFKELMNFLQEQNVDLTDIKTSPMDDDIPPSKATENIKPESNEVDSKKPANNEAAVVAINQETNNIKYNADAQIAAAAALESEAPVFEFRKCLSPKWSTGAGPRIGCVRDYPTNLQFKALEQVNLSPKVVTTRGQFAFPINCNPIPSPRPSPNVHLSPRLAYMGLPSPRAIVTSAN